MLRPQTGRLFRKQASAARETCLITQTLQAAEVVIQSGHQAGAVVAAN
jgi:hypothetical protein